MRVPRDVNADELVKALVRYGYTVVRQTGSHIRLSQNTDKGEHAITIPNHNPIKIGTLQSIAKDVCRFNKIDLGNFYGQL